MPMINRVPLTATARWGARLMTRVDAVSEAGSSPWGLAGCGGSADHRPSETDHLGNPGSGIAAAARRPDPPGAGFDDLGGRALDRSQHARAAGPLGRAGDGPADPARGHPSSGIPAPLGRAAARDRPDLVTPRP